MTMDYGLLLYHYGIDKCVTYDRAQLTWCNTVFALSIKILTHRSLWCIDCCRVPLVLST